MPSFVILISLLSFMSFLYAVKAFSLEVHHMQLAVQPFGGGLHRVMEHALRLGMAALFLAFAIVSVLMSGALVWLSFQPGMVG